MYTPYNRIKGGSNRFFGPQMNVHLLKIELIDCPGTSVDNHESELRKIPEERKISGVYRRSRRPMMVRPSNSVSLNDNWCTFGHMFRCVLVSESFLSECIKFYGC